MVVVKDGNYFLVKSEDMKRVMGKHRTKKDALKQLRAIEIAKHKRGKKD